MSEAGAARRRSMQNMPVVDLSGVRSREEVAGLRIHNVAVVLVPADLPDLLRDADCENVALILPVIAGTTLESRTGDMELSGDSLAGGDEHAILLLVGRIVVTSEVTKVGYRGLILVGEPILPRSAQRALAGKIINQTGHVVYYDGENPRVFGDGTRFTKAFFELVQEPLVLVAGDCTFAADVTPELLRQKVRSLALSGEATVERADLEPVVQYLATSTAGRVTVAAPGAGSGS